MERQQPSLPFGVLTMIERAKEELEMLEAEHPNRFEYLKLELKSLISLAHPPLPTTSTATTQASTSGTKRKRGRFVEGVALDEKETRKKKMMKEEEKDRVDIALERAQACIRKIHDLKVQLIC